MYFMEIFVSQTAKLFENGRSQAVRLPVAFRFDVSEAYISQDPVSGDVTLSKRPRGWNEFFAARAVSNVPDDFLTARSRQQGEHHRDPFAK